jgi:hypothetical protein
MEIIHCFKDQNWSCIADWSISHIIWEVVQYLLIFVCLKILWDLFNAFIISRKILSKNRITKGYGYGKKRADVFIELWYSDKNFDSMISECFSTGATQGHSNTKIGNIVENELFPIKLAEVFEINDIRKVRAIKNFRNLLVFYIVRFYLIHFIGDNPKYYRDLKRQ